MKKWTINLKFSTSIKIIENNHNNYLNVMLILNDSNSMIQFVFMMNQLNTYICPN
jgi:hypothetical protein